MKKQFYGRQHKATILDYDYMNALSDAECCYSLSEREIQLLLAIIEPIGWATRYEQERSEIDQPTIEQWRDNLARKLMSGCCPDDGRLERFTEDGTFQTSDDGGTTWVDNPDADPRNQAVQNPPLPGSPGDSKRCAAADNVRDIFTQYRDNLNAMLDASPTLVSIIAGILAFLAIITGISGAAIGISVLLMGLASFMLSLESGGVTALITTEVLDQFRCLVYCRMDSDGRLTYEKWQLLLTDIADTFADFPELFFYQTVNAMGYIGVNNAGTTGAATASDCGDCDCPEDCGDVTALASHLVFGTIIDSGTDIDGRQFLTVESEVQPGVNVIRWGVIEGTVPPNMCCWFHTWDNVVSGASSSVYTDCDGVLHLTNASDQAIGHIDLYNTSNAFTAKLIFGV